MTVEDSNVVDFVSPANDRSVVRLVVSDHLDWEAEGQHLYKLQEKLNRYLAFIEAGELARKYPDLATMQMRIEVFFLHEPSDHALQHFLRPTQERIRSAGFDFAWNVGPAT